MERHCDMTSVHFFDPQTKILCRSYAPQATYTSGCLQQALANNRHPQKLQNPTHRHKPGAKSKSKLEPKETPKQKFKKSNFACNIPLPPTRVMNRVLRPSTGVSSFSHGSKSSGSLPSLRTDWGARFHDVLSLTRLV